MIENGYAEGMEADRQPFQPKLYRSRYTSRIKSRYMSASRHVIDQTFLSRGSSVDSSEQGSLNKSREMVASVEEHFFKKMYCIFIEEDTEFV